MIDRMTDTAFDLGRLRASVLTLTCTRCTRTQTFGVPSISQGRIDVRNAGWIQRGGRSVCPKCPQTPAEIDFAKAASAQ